MLHCSQGNTAFHFLCVPVKLYGQLISLFVPAAHWLVGEEIPTWSVGALDGIAWPLIQNAT